MVVRSFRSDRLLCLALTAFHLRLVPLREREILNITINDEPALVSAKDVADQIVERLYPQELPAGMGKWLREKFPSGWCYVTDIAYSGYDRVTLHSYIRPDGSIELILNDTNGAVFWRTVLRPASD
jgi:hypothetical protein